MNPRAKIMRRAATRFGIGLGLACVLVLGACDSVVFSDTDHLTASNPVLARSQFTETVPTGSLTHAQLEGLSRAYHSEGDGALHFIVTYDPQSRTNTARQAAAQASALKTAFALAGVQNAESAIAPLENSGKHSSTTISFNTIEAHADAACPQTLATVYNDPDMLDKYKLGCTIQTYTARQIARPKDLEGNGNMDNASGRKTTNSLEDYMQGKPNTELKGNNASDSTGG